MEGIEIQTVLLQLDEKAEHCKSGMSDLTVM